MRPKDAAPVETSRAVRRESVLGQTETRADGRGMPVLPPGADMSTTGRFAPRSGLALVHSMTSSALARSAGGTERPSFLAVFRLMDKSNLVA